MIHRLQGKHWLYFAMALCLFAVLLAGLIHLAVNGAAHVRTMDAGQFRAFVDGPQGNIGSVYDRQGEVLFSPDQPVDRSVHSLVGSLAPMITNSVVQRFDLDLMGWEGYSLWQGADSLEGTGADLFLTLDAPTQQAVTTLLEKHQVSGLVAACDASTGALLCLASTPAAGSEEDVTTLPDGALLNKNLYTTMAGSTMKVVTTALLVEQAGLDALTAYRCPCTGSDILAADGTAIVCSTRQGEQDIVSALGVSCNVFFANAIEEFLDPAVTTEALDRYGFAPQQERKPLDLMTYSPSQVTFADHTFSSVWQLMGQVTTVSPLDMLRFTAALFHQGQAPTPYLLAAEANRTHTKLLFQANPDRQAILSPETAAQVTALWTEAYTAYYDTAPYSPYLTAAKTGTAQQGNGQVNKLLLGYSKELDVVFFLSLEDWRPDSGLPTQEVANCLLESLAASGCAAAS